MSQSTLVYRNVSSRTLDRFLAEGFLEETLKNEYELRRLKKEKTTIILYSSGKLVINATTDLQSWIERTLPDNQQHKKQSDTSHKKTLQKKISQKKTSQHEPEISGKIPDTGCHIGSDETLKGDTFGGLIVCACLVCKDKEQTFKDLGVRDSKRLNTEEIEHIGSQLLSHHEDDFSITELSPKEYNKKLKSLSSTSLLDELHHKTTRSLKQMNKGKNAPVIVDKYPGCNTGDIILEKAESHSTAVAAASIVARYKGIIQIRRLSNKAGIDIPFGSTHVTVALKRLKEKRLAPKEFCKSHFSNVKNVFRNL